MSGVVAYMEAAGVVRPDVDLLANSMTVCTARWIYATQPSEGPDQAAQDPSDTR